MKKLVELIIVTFLALATSAHAGMERVNPPPATSYTTRPVTFLEKNFWVDGGHCNIQRWPHMPDMTTFVTTMPEHLREDVISVCIEGAKQKEWEKQDATMLPTYFGALNSYREARTLGMGCTIMGSPAGPLMYQIRFSSFALTGKEKEIRECMSRASDSMDKARQQPTDTPRVREIDPNI